MRLSAFILDNMDPILKEWETFARTLNSGRDKTAASLRDHARAILETIAHDLTVPQSGEQQQEKSQGKGPAFSGTGNEESAPTQHGAGRLHAGFSIEEMIAEYRALRASVLRLWGKSSTWKDTDYQDMSRFNEAVDQAVAESVARYSSELRQSQHMFLAILGHDLRNPLGAIVMSAEGLALVSQAESSQGKAARVILNSGRRMRRLIDDLLDFTRVRLGQQIPVVPQPADMGEIVRQAVEEAQAVYPEREIRFETAGDVRGSWDVGRLYEVVSNLLDNGIKHGSGMLTVRVSPSEESQNVILVVHNTGQPIQDTDLSQIFEPLRRARGSAGKQGDSGLGLGLYIAREIVQAHHGRIEVTSSASDGTAFTARLPRHL